LIILIQLPISVAIGFILLQAFGISSNIMSLELLAIGVVVDDGIVMVENAYRSISEDKKKWILINNRTMKIYLKDIQKKQDPLSSEERMKLIEDSSKLVGPGVFTQH
jgi:Cu/Ag efflux pump CusA